MFAIAIAGGCFFAALETTGAFAGFFNGNEEGIVFGVVFRGEREEPFLIGVFLETVFLIEGGLSSSVGLRTGFFDFELFPSFIKDNATAKAPQTARTLIIDSLPTASLPSGENLKFFKQKKKLYY